MREGQSWWGAEERWGGGWPLMPPSEHQSPGASGAPCGLSVHPRLPGEGLGSGQSPPALLAFSVTSVSSRSAIVIGEPQPPPGMDHMGESGQDEGLEEEKSGEGKSQWGPQVGQGGRGLSSQPG